MFQQLRAGSGAHANQSSTTRVINKSLLDRNCKVYDSMLQKYQEVQAPNVQPKFIDPHNKAEILQLLSLKQCIYQYEGPEQQINQDYILYREQSNNPPQTTHTPKKKRPHRRIQSKNASQTKFDPKSKTQSERVFKNREAIEQSKKELLRGSTNDAKKDKTHSQNDAFQNRFNSIQLHQTKEKSIMRKTVKAASTIAHAKIIHKGHEQSEKKIQGNMQMRLKTFLSKYRSNYQLQKAKLKEVDQQHKRIEELVNQLTNDRDFNQREDSESEENDQTDPKKLEEVPDVNLRRVPKNKPNNQTLKGLLKERYQIIGRIGKGLSGEVYKGKDILSQRYVAIKVSDSGKESEYQFYKKVQHRYIINYLNNFTQKGKRYLILEYLPFTLETLAKKRKFSEEEVKKVFKCLVSALMFLHGLGIAHRDIKMENIVCSEDLTVIKFIDFGLCIDIGQHDSLLSRQFCGTIGYMPPQILQKRAYDPKKADIWSLGILLYKLAFDRFPYRGKNEQEILIRISKSKLVFPEYCNENLKHLLEKMLCRNAGNRLNISEVIEHRWLL